MSSYTPSYSGVRQRILNAKHHFHLLGVHRRSTQEELTTARRALARLLHPDVNSAPDASDLMARVNAAHEVLSTELDKYVHTLKGASCIVCAGTGCKTRQISFTKVLCTVCRHCHGSGRV